MNPQKRLLDAIYPEPTIPAITLWQPWATWIALGWKTIETRGHDRFRNLVGKRIAIHGGEKIDPFALEFARPFLSLSRVDESRRTMQWGCPKGVVCTALVKEARWLEYADSMAALCQCDSSRFGLVLTDVRQVDPPIWWRGSQGIWQLPIDALTPGPAAVHEIVEGLSP